MILAVSRTLNSNNQLIRYRINPTCPDVGASLICTLGGAFHKPGPLQIDSLCWCLVGERVLRVNTLSSFWFPSQAFQARIGTLLAAPSTVPAPPIGTRPKQRRICVLPFDWITCAQCEMGKAVEHHSVPVLEFGVQFPSVNFICLLVTHHKEIDG